MENKLLSQRVSLKHLIFDRAPFALALPKKSTRRFSVTAFISLESILPIWPLSYLSIQSVSS